MMAGQIMTVIDEVYMSVVMVEGYDKEAVVANNEAYIGQVGNYKQNTHRRA